MALPTAAWVGGNHRGDRVMVKRLSRINPELRLIWTHFVALFVPGRMPWVPEVYEGTEAKDLRSWSRPSLVLLLDEARSHLEALNSQFESVRHRSQYLVATSLALSGAIVGLRTHLTRGPLNHVLWILALVISTLALLLSFTAFASTAQLGSVDPVLFSLEDGRREDVARRSLARAYVKAIKRTTASYNARYTLYRDAIWLLVVAAIAATIAWFVQGPKL